LTLSRSWPAAGTSPQARASTCPSSPPGVLKAAVDEAHRHGLQVTAHAHAVGAIAAAVAAGADGMEHVSLWTEDRVDAPAGLIKLIADRGRVVGATIGMIPVPGLKRQLPGGSGPRTAGYIRPGDGHASHLRREG
jgi:hypothetical protein